MSEEIDLREQEAISLGAKHCIYFGDNNEFRLYLSEINRYVLSSVFVEFATDPIVGAEKLLGSVCISKVSDLNQFFDLPSGSALGVATEIMGIIEVKKSLTKKL